MILLSRYGIPDSIPRGNPFISLIGDANFNRFSGSGTLAFSGSSVYSGSTQLFIAKYFPTGALNWQKVLGDTSTSQVGSATAVDSSGNIITVGYDTASPDIGIIASHDSDGNVNWQRKLSGAVAIRYQEIAIDSNDDIIAVGRGNDGTYFTGLAVKYNSSGTLQWQKELNSPAGDLFYGVATSGTDIYIANESTGSTDYDLSLVKLDSSGTVTWQYEIGLPNPDSDFARNIATDSSGNVIAVTHGPYGAGNNDLYVVKLNSSATIQWQKSIGTASSDTSVAITTDNTDAVYVSGQTPIGGQNYGYIAKWNSSGTLQWQRTLGTTGGATLVTNIHWSDGFLYISAATNGLGAGNYDALALKLPDDGTLTGSYSFTGGTLDYASASLTESVETLTTASTSYTVGTSTYTDAATTYTANTSTFTPELVIP